jgi:hypothetical protein
MKTADSPEMLVTIYQTTKRHITEDSNLHSNELPDFIKGVEFIDMLSDC